MLKRIKKKFKGWNHKKLIGVFTLPIFLVLVIELYKIMNRVEDVSFWDDIDDFEPHEFDENTKDGAGTGLKYMQQSFITQLQKARDYSGVVYTINCGYRSPIYNIEIGGVKNSTHIYGMAGDIGADDKEHFLAIERGLKDAGFVRIGYYITKKNNLFLHADNSELHPQVKWYYIRVLKDGKPYKKKVNRTQFFKALNEWTR